MQIVMALIVGLIFGLGLIVSGMADPSKVLNFLDLAGEWDPSLAFVMGGAILVSFFAFRFAVMRQKSILGQALRLPNATHVDLRLIVGSLLFGMGWGLVGYCPGPALVSLTTGNPKSIIFIVAMLAGMVIFEGWERLSVSGRTQPS